MADPGCVAEVDEHFLADLTVSQEIDPQAWQESSPAHPGQGACDRAGAPVPVSDSLWTDSDEATHEEPAVTQAALVDDFLAAVAEE